MHAEQENAQDKQDVIEPLGQDVLKAENNIGFYDPGNRLPGKHFGE